MIKSFRIKVTLVLILSMLFMGAACNFLIYRFALDLQFDYLRNKLIMVAQTAALLLDADILMRIPLVKEGANTAEFKAVAEKLEKIKQANPSIRYVYILTKTEEEGMWQFVVDPEPEPELLENGKDVSPSCYPGDKYDASRFFEMINGFETPSADRQLEIDAWGTSLSGYAPIRDRFGKSVAMLGIDIMADEIYELQKDIHQRAAFVLVFGIILSLALGMRLSRGITDPVKKLLEGTCRLADGDLSYQVELKGDDEISRLAGAFNSMAKALLNSREKMKDYFYKAMQSLVRILEAKDPYTRGHSDRVGEYAEKIALKMSFLPEKAALLKKTAVLHDIGKLVIQDNILNKKEKLTEEEWKIIQEHTIVGENILKPVFFDVQLLKIIRSHHEHYDGKGYPDKIKGAEIDIFAQIVCVADSYDAMTSVRAYRPALKKEEAIAELKKNKGTQFNPEIVNAFLCILEEDPIS